MSNKKNAYQWMHKWKHKCVQQFFLDLKSALFSQEQSIHRLVGLEYNVKNQVSTELYGGGGGGGYSLKIWLGVCSTLLETLTLFQTKSAQKPYPCTTHRYPSSFCKGYPPPPDELPSEHTRENAEDRLQGQSATNLNTRTQELAVVSMLLNGTSCSQHAFEWKSIPHTPYPCTTHRYPSSLCKGYPPPPR